MQIVFACNKDAAKAITKQHAAKSCRTIKPLWQYINITADMMAAFKEGCNDKGRLLNQVLDDHTVSMTDVPASFMAAVIVAQVSENTYVCVRDASAETGEHPF